MFVLIVLTIIAILLYINSPEGYSDNYTIYCLLTFLFSSIIVLIKNCKDNIVKFEFFFLIAIFFTNYVYTVVYYQVNPYFSLFNLSFDESYISKGLGLSTVGLCFFNLGVYDGKCCAFTKQYNISSQLLFPKYLMIILSVVFIPYLFTLSLLGEYTTEFESSLINVVLVYLVYYTIYVFFANRLSCNSLYEIVSSSLVNPFFWIISLYMVLFLIIGSRTIPLRIVFLSLILYNCYIVKITKFKVLSICLLGAFFMTFVGLVRDGGNFTGDSVSSIWDLGKDLVINNRSLYVLMEYADVHGYNYGETMLSNILSVFPFLQSIYLSLTGSTVSDISSGNLVTDLFFSENPNMKSFGLGTNLIGDIYVSFGVIGVAVLMFSLGFLLKKLYRLSCEGNHNSLLIYALLFMDVIYLPRSSFFTSLRSVTWVLFISYICSYVHIYGSCKKRSE